MDATEYTLCEHQNLREGPGLQYARKTSTGSLESDRFGRLIPGICIEIFEVKELSVSVWGRCREGWLCLSTEKVTYAKPREDYFCSR